MTASLANLRRCFDGTLLTEEADVAPFLTDWRKRWHGRAMAVAQPDTTRDVALILGWCNHHGVPVVPQGGNTGLSGGSIPDRSGLALVLSLARLNRFRGIDPGGNTLVAEAGCTLQAVQDAAEQAGRLFPLSLAAEGSCTVGGILSTNAGGVHVLHYGSTRSLCLGLEVVTPAAEIWDGLRHLRKDNSGLDLRDLFIGAEGTLGVITAAVLRMVPRPTDRSVAFAAVPSPEAGLRLLAAAQERAGVTPTAFELIDSLSLDLVERHRPGLSVPLARSSPWYVLIENSVWDAEDQASRALTTMLAAAWDNGIVSDAVISTSAAQCTTIWAVREAVSDAQAAEGSVIKHDVALPITGVPRFLAAADEAIHTRFPGLRPAVFGHLGDGNLHYNILPQPERCGAADAGWLLRQEPAVNRMVHDLVAAQGGSVSAEHGVGVLRREEAARYKSAVELRLLDAVKAAIDPMGLMNPGKGVAAGG